MRLRSSEKFTYLGYLHQTWFDRNEADELDIHATLQHFGQMAGPVMGLMPMFFVIDYSTRKYLIFTDNIRMILGHDARELLEGGLAHTVDLVQKDFFRTFNQNVFPSTIAALSRIPRKEHHNHIFSNNFQYRNRKGDYVNVLQRNTYITSRDTHMPLYCIGMAMDISAYKRDLSVVQTIERVDLATRVSHTIETNYFYPFEEHALLTRQELNIVKYMADGMSSKVIAYKLGLSENTIANHRKNMLRKTNTKNVAQLIAFVVRNGVI
jgi:DNA-binding CsgD family transcriptional regulator